MDRSGGGEARGAVPMIRRFVITEKALRLAERENKITVVVDRAVTKK